MRRTWMGGTTALALALAACAGEDEAAGEATMDGDRVSACALVPPAEVAAILGAPSADSSGRFEEHSYTKPVTYSSSCMYRASEGMVMVTLHYPVPGTAPSSAELAQRVTEHLRSTEESDSAIAAAYREVQVQPVSDLPAPAALYELAGTTTLEARVGNRTVQVIAGSPDAARRVALMVIERLG